MEHADMVSEYPKLAQAFAEELDRFPHSLAVRHPRIAHKLDALWGTPECLAVLDELMLSGRPDRRGFSFGVVCELFSLKELHDNQFPQRNPNTSDPFSTALSDVARADSERRRALAKQGDNGSALDRRHDDTAMLPQRVPAGMLGAPPVGPGEKPATMIQKKASWPKVESLDDLQRIMTLRSQGERTPARDPRQLMEIQQQYVVLADKDIDAAIKIQALKGRKREPIGKILLMMGVVTDELVTRALCLQYGVLMVNLQRFQIFQDIKRLIPLDEARKARVVPIAVIDGLLFLAVGNPFNFDQREYFGFLTKLKIELVMVPAERITQYLEDYGQLQSVQQGDQEFRSLAKRALAETATTQPVNDDQELEGGNGISQDDASVVGLVNKFISDAAEVGASDIHLECFALDPQAHIRFRRDGRMEGYSQYSANYHRAVVSRIKIMANLNIAERRMAQDGKISFSRPGQPRLDLRVATIPTVRGIENVTIRLLQAGDPVPIDQLKMGERDLTVFKRLIEKPYGLILVCGPTGSGKTTTLHSVLRELNTPDRKIWTAEDPIEIVQKNVNQVQMNPKIGWTFATALRAFLRADPDIIMIGEMRDLETAKIALEASMTGHLVLSTLHTNSASETAARLLDLEIDPFNLADALVCVLAQRLARSLCTRCAPKRVMTTAEIDELAAEYYFSAYERQASMADKERIVRGWQARLPKGEFLNVWQPKGCRHCSGEGYKGRIPLFELMEVTPQIRELIAHQSTATEYKRIAVDQGMRTLKQDGIEKVLLGLTDMTQVRGVCN
ncbi:MAG: GspE/PulE family protein [Gammaproteobacteria bacterium]|nr:type II/IV secretion system protein [Rhodocyclaceae bacterium]MBU3910722.1 GspE/PulE family protein [Gammaproteobacteria bacterium]MBU3988492.1 GspE/PulE family protein [Gammaproteobacteria bacterium]MBU4003431.1 GspE/PulE family protein [Gammaproteobacteria bacterium]MBU4021902.1 GspE/PulE family protein [Gammaproteobacteria bacterium]